MSDGGSAREKVLRAAGHCVMHDRNASYGEPDQDFTRTADVLNALGFSRNGRELMGFDIAHLMIALKLSRLSWNPAHFDSWVDIAGYAACGYETAELRKDEPFVDAEGSALGVTNAQRSDPEKLMSDVRDRVLRNARDDLAIIRNVADKHPTPPVDLTGR